MAKYSAGVCTFRYTPAHRIGGTIMAMANRNSGKAQLAGFSASLLRFSVKVT